VEIGFVILGAVLATYGWYWGGVTESRTSAYAMATGSALLALTFAFGGGGSDIVTGGFFALGAIYGFLATANAWNESSQDRTYGLFALLFGIVAFFGYTIATDNNAPGQISLGALVVAGTMILHFISAALVPTNKGFKALAGWVTLAAGVALVYFGFAEALGNGMDPL
jgi:hypothetical protein